jgi:hypothetical protein
LVAMAHGSSVSPSSDQTNKKKDLDVLNIARAQG